MNASRVREWVFRHFGPVVLLALIAIATGIEAAAQPSLDGALNVIARVGFSLGILGLLCCAPAISRWVKGIFARAR